MATKQYAGKAVEVTDDGYLINSTDWSPEVAADIAREEEIELTPAHHDLITFIRDKVAKGETLTIRAIGKSGICDIKGFYKLFPGAPLKKASRIAGIKKPQSCV